MYDPLGKAMVAAGDRALTGDQAMYDALGEAMVTADLGSRQCMMPWGKQCIHGYCWRQSSDWGSGNV